MKRNEDNIRDLWDNTKCNNIHIIGAQKEEREKGTKKIFEEIVSKNFHNMRKKTVNKVQEVQRVPGRKNSRKNTSSHTVINLTKIKNKDKIFLKNKGKRRITYKRTPIRLSAKFSTENLQPRRERHIESKSESCSVVFDSL